MSSQNQETIDSPLESLGFDNSYFNSIICFGVFDACYQSATLAELLRVLSENNGCLVVSGNFYASDDVDVLKPSLRLEINHTLITSLILVIFKPYKL